MENITDSGLSFYISLVQGIMDHKSLTGEDKLEEEENMRDLILEKLSKMEDLEQRKMLKDIMSSLFTNLIDYQEEATNNLKERIFSEVEDSEKKYDIYIT
jgi:hypothetical protein